jgi:uncharacterized damage-inducible protein DinB
MCAERSAFDELTGSINLAAGQRHSKMAGMKDHFSTFAHYNAWANCRVYDAAAKLSDADYRADRGAFFKSMHGTLNHLLTTDRIWMQRFTGTGDAPQRLDAILHERLADLRAARDAEDRRIVTYIDGLDEAAFAGVIRYRRVSTPEEFVQPLAPALAHWFNHQTHHRGQAHMILTSLGKSAPELDLLYFQRLKAAGQA